MSFKHRSLWTRISFFFLLNFWSPNELIASPSHLIVVVPIYRELYNQNLGALLSSLARQDLDPTTPIEIEALFIVNNTQGADLSIRTENQETVAFLNALGARQVPIVEERSLILRQSILDVLASSIKISVLDYTTPGFADRNIGRVRDIGNRYILDRLTADERSQVLISQMDGDTRVPPNFVRILQETFSNSRIAFALLDLTFGYEVGSEPAIYRRMITGQIDFAAWRFIDASKGQLPLSGSPRIVARASSIAAVNGIPHVVVGEDTQLVANLKAKFPGRQGVFLENLAVVTSYRGREDGYDAAWYESRKSLPIEMSEDATAACKEVDAVEKFAESRANLSGIWRRLLRGALTQHESEVKKRRAGLAMLLNAKQMGSAMNLNGIDSLFAAPWFNEYLENQLAIKKGNREAAIAAISSDFPHLLSTSFPSEILLLARFTAAARILRDPAYIAETVRANLDLETLRQEYETIVKHHLDAVKEFEKSARRESPSNVYTESRSRDWVDKYRENRRLREEKSIAETHRNHSVSNLVDLAIRYRTLIKHARLIGDLEFLDRILALPDATLRSRYARNDLVVGYNYSDPFVMSPSGEWSQYFYFWRRTEMDHSLAFNEIDQDTWAQEQARLRKGPNSEFPHRRGLWSECALLMAALIPSQTNVETVH